MGVGAGRRKGLVMKFIIGNSLSVGCSTSNPASMSGKAPEDGPSAWALATHGGDLGDAPDPWLFPRGKGFQSDAKWPHRITDLLKNNS